MRLSPSIVVAISWVAAASPALAQPAPRRVPTVAELDARVVELEARTAELGNAAVGSPELAASVGRLEAAVAALRQDVDELKKVHAGSGELVVRVDGIDGRLAELGERVASLRADLESRTSPESAARGGSGVWADGFRLVDEPRYSLRLTGYSQLRYTLRTGEAAGEGESLPDSHESGFALRRLRLGFDGRVHSPRLRYHLLVELTGGARLLDGFVEGDLPRGFFLRGGQMKVPLSGSFAVEASRLLFVERSLATDELRHDRDLGLVAGWRGWKGRLEVVAGVLNGSGPQENQNDNLDPLLVARVRADVLGDALWQDGEGDLARSEHAALRLGAGLSFENTPMPAIVGYGGAALREGQNLDVDVDGDGKRDNVAVLMVGVDAAFRYRGLGLEAELTWRDEDWGVIGDAQNPTLPYVPSRSYLGGFAQASFVVLPRLVVGGRYARTEVSPLLLGRTRSEAPVDERRWEASALVSYQRLAHGIELSAMYSFLDWSDRTPGVGTEDVGAAGAGEQRLIVETQVAF